MVFLKGVEKEQILYVNLNVNRANVPCVVAHAYGCKAVLEKEQKWRLYMYPYFLFQANLEAKNKLYGSRNTYISFAVDARQGHFNLAQGLPEHGDQAHEGSIILPPIFSAEEAMQFGIRDFRARSCFSFKYAFLSFTKVTLTVVYCRLIYKPYWLVDLVLPKGQRVSRVIDGVTGELGGVQGYRVMQGISVACIDEFKSSNSCYTV